MTPAERTAMYAATCRCCLLAAAMRDCQHCVFNVLEPETVQFGPVDDEPQSWWNDPDREPDEIAEATDAAYMQAQDGWLCGNNVFADHEEWRDWIDTREGSRPL